MAYKNIFDTEKLLAESREITGIDIEDTDALEPLSALCNSMINEANLHQRGAEIQQQKLLRLLSNRLRMQRDIAKHPEILHQTVNAPIFLCGMGRTGSTKSQKLLASSGDLNWLPFWQSLYPSLISGNRSEPTESRIQATNHWVQEFDAASPNAQYIHAFRTFQPEEESFILEQSLINSCFLGWCNIPGYLQWLATQDPTRQFYHLKDALKYLQWQGLQEPNRRWVLKCPLYFGLEPAIKQVFPDATLVMTHRHPRETMASTCSLLDAYYKPHTDAPIDYQVLVAGFAHQMQRHLDIRKMHPELDILDIDYRELITSVETVIEKIYRHARMTLSEESKQRMLDWDTSNPKHKSGTHKYSLDDFGLDAKAIDGAYTDYIGFLANSNA